MFLDCAWEKSAGGKEATTTARFVQSGTTAVQQVVPNFFLNFSANSSAAVSHSSRANVVEPLPDISVAAAP